MIFQNVNHFWCMVPIRPDCPGGKMELGGDRVPIYRNHVVIFLLMQGRLQKIGKRKTCLCNTWTAPEMIPRLSEVFLVIEFGHYFLFSSFHILLSNFLYNWNWFQHYYNLPWVPCKIRRQPVAACQGPSLQGLLSDPGQDLLGLTRAKNKHFLLLLLFILMRSLMSSCRTEDSCGPGGWLAKKS